ncbi:cytochrome P450 [Mycolicibacterium sp. XJ879]
MQFNHHSPEFATHWREQYAEMRAKCPVAHSDEFGGFYIATDFSSVQQILHDPQNFRCGRGLDVGTGETIPGGVTIPTNPVRMGMMEMDPPRSQTLRKIIAGRFSKKAVNDYAPRMQALVSWCVDRVIERGSIDFVDDLANPTPALITVDYLGLPLTNWEFYATTLHKAAYREKGSASAVGEMLDDIRAIVRDRQSQRRGDDSVIEQLLDGQEDGEPISEDIAVEMIFMLLNGGIDTTTALIANSFLFFDEHRDKWEWLREDLSRVPAAVDELIRYTSPSTGVARTVANPVTVHDVDLEPGDRVLLALGSANADPEVFDDPAEVHLDRQRNRHLSFGSGMHRCIGTYVAVQEMTLLLREVLRRLPDYRIRRDKVVAYPTVPLVNGYIAMPATFTPGPKLMGGVLADDLPYPLDRVAT